MTRVKPTRIEPQEPPTGVLIFFHNVFGAEPLPFRQRRLKLEDSGGRREGVVARASEEDSDHREQLLARYDELEKCGNEDGG